MQFVTVYASSLEEIIWLDWAIGSRVDGFAVVRYQLHTDTTSKPDLYALLQPDERERAGRYRRKEDQNRFVFGRALTRICLGRFTGQSPAHIQLVMGVNNKPELKGAEGTYFNLSHAGNWIVLAINSSAVGIDVEKVNPEFSFQDMLSSSFSPQEQDWVQNSDNPAGQFYQLWTRKEALIKATAKGMDDDFQRIPSLAGKHPIAADLIGDGGSWTVAGFGVDDDYPAAVAYRSAGETPKFYTMESGLLGLI